MKKGIFIVIDGSDGSGKATQAKLLIEHMKQEGLAVETISFPQYGQKSAGPLEKYLSGTYGSASEVGPYQTSVLFAVDRFDAAPKIHGWLESGINVVADRYVGSNMGHQGSKIDDPDERKKYFLWNEQFEHDLMGIPKPDLNIVLHVPTNISEQLIAKRDAAGGQKHDLKKDVHESDPEHLKRTEQAYLELAQLYDYFQLIECIENESLLPPDEIHHRIWQIITSQINLF
ncbi:thymidylate kinase [Patescibacteria group bacterium]|nr:thymidylate kinase [Patescibacteria group bacterium]